MKFRSEREQWMVIGGCLFLALSLYYSLLLGPLMSKIARDRKALPARQKDLTEAQRLAADYVTLKKVPQPHSSGTPVNAVDEITQQLDIKDNVSSLVSQGDRGFTLKLRDVDGPTLVRLLYELDRRGIHPDLEMHDFSGNGLWTVTCTVASAPPS